MTLRADLVDFEPPRRRWRSWAGVEPVLAGTDSGRLRAELKTAGRERCDELLAALGRLACVDPDAQTMLIGCLWPGIAARAARYARRADRADAVSLLVTELVADLTSGHSADHQFVATALLERPTGALRRAMRRERAWIDRGGRDRTDVEREPTGGEVVLSGRVLLGLAVDAGILSGRDAWLIYVTDVEDRSLRWAAHRLGIGYPAAIKRRQRAKAAWHAWWDCDRVPSRETSRGCPEGVMSRPQDVLGRPARRRRSPSSRPVDPTTRSVSAEPADEVIDLRSDDVGVDLRVREVVERAPTLSAEQVDKLRFLLPPAGGDSDAAT